MLAVNSSFECKSVRLKIRKQKYQLFEITFETYLAVEMYESFFIYSSSAFFLFLQIILQNVSFVTCIMIYKIFYASEIMCFGINK